jgi:hypothetical protein
MPGICLGRDGGDPCALEICCSHLGRVVGLGRLALGGREGLTWDTGLQCMWEVP